jgi:hypothetical protein
LPCLTGIGGGIGDGPRFLTAADTKDASFFSNFSSVSLASFEFEGSSSTLLFAVTSI